jgi:hypothetical protein
MMLAVPANIRVTLTDTELCATAESLAAQVSVNAHFGGASEELISAFLNLCEAADREAVRLPERAVECRGTLVADPEWWGRSKAAPS